MNAARLPSILEEKMIMPNSPMRAFREAFSKAKRGFKPLLKTQDNPFFHSKYAGLSDVHAAVDEALIANGFTIHQCFDFLNDSNVLITKLCHIDGFQESSTIRISTKDDSDPQKMGSAISYFRRYALSALLGIAAEDDDGNTASKPSTSSEARLPQASSGSDFRFSFGKYSGKTFDEIPPGDLAGYIQWMKKPDMKKTAEENKKNLQKNQPIFAAYDIWLKSAQDDEPPPYDPSEDSNIPF